MLVRREPLTAGRPHLTTSASGRSHGLPKKEELNSWKPASQVWEVDFGPSFHPAFSPLPWVGVRGMNPSPAGLS